MSRWLTQCSPPPEHRNLDSRSRSVGSDTPHSSLHAEFVVVLLTAPNAPPSSAIFSPGLPFNNLEGFSSLAQRDHRRSTDASSTDHLIGSGVDSRMSRSFMLRFSNSQDSAIDELDLQTNSHVFLCSLTPCPRASSR